MIVAILVGVVGLASVALGSFTMLMALMPKWGGGNDAWAFPLGIAIFVIGIGLIFAAGAMI